MSRTVRTILLVLLCCAAAGAAFSAGYVAHMAVEQASGSLPHPTPVPLQVSPSDETVPELDEQHAFALFWEAWHLVERHFFGEVPSPQQMTYGAIRGVISELDDPFTTFVEPARRELEQDEHRGRFGGIGVWIYQREDTRQFVLTPQEDGPAQKAGVVDGDVLVEVDGTAVTPEMPPDDVIALIRGPVDSEVRLVVERAGRRLAFTITRAEFDTPSVEWRMLDDRAAGLGYVRLTLFTERTGAEMETALRELQARGMKRLILDLRDNPGGLLDAALDVSSQFLRDGVIMYEIHRDGSEKTYPVQAGDKPAADIPMVVLINGGTASAAEIVAGALKDHARALIVGENSYGKGSVQLVFDLSDGSSIHITVARWLTPGRSPIDGLGVEPDRHIAASAGDTQEDPQLDAAIAEVIARGP